MIGCAEGPDTKGTQKMDEKPSDPAAHPPMRIAMIVPPWYELPPPGYGGLERMCSPLVDGLVARGHQVTLFGAGTKTGTRAEFVSTNDELQYSRMGQAMPEMLHVCRANQMISEESFDVVHDHTMVGLLTAASRPVPTVATVHGCPQSELGDYLCCLGDAVSLIAISDSQRRLNPNLTWSTTVHHGLPLDPGNALATPDGPVLWLARFNPEKGPDLAINACREAGVPLILAGKCNEPNEHEYFQDVVRPLLGPDVTLVMNAERSRTDALLREAGCLLLPLRWEEPFGLVMIEAMAVGTPVVALRHGSVPEVVDDGVTGIICDDPAELPGALEKVRQLDPQDCVDRVRTEFSPEKMVLGYEAVYRDQARMWPLFSAGSQNAGEVYDIAVYDHVG
jgi:glycosyltransferase involved in cell wall biosynthesis